MHADSGRCPHLGSNTPTISPIWLLCLSKHTVPSYVGTHLNHTFCWNFLFRLKTSLWDVEMGIRGPQCPSMFRQHSFTYFIWNDDQKGLWWAPQGPDGQHRAQNLETSPVPARGCRSFKMKNVPVPGLYPSSSNTVADDENGSLSRWGTFVILQDSSHLLTLDNILLSLMLKQTSWMWHVA